MLKGKGKETGSGYGSARTSPVTIEGCVGDTSMSHWTTIQACFGAVGRVMCFCDSWIPADWWGFLELPAPAFQIHSFTSPSSMSAYNHVHFPEAENLVLLLCVTNVPPAASRYVSPRQLHFYFANPNRQYWQSKWLYAPMGKSYEKIKIKNILGQDASNTKTWLKCKSKKLYFYLAKRQNHRMG